MTIWAGEIKELDNLYESFKGHLPDIVKELEQLIRTDDANVVMLYSRRCLEVIITDLCECELKRPRKTEPLKGIIDKLNSEEKVPSYIITSMHSLNSMATFGTHPKDFDPEQVKPVLNNLAIIIRWYLKYKDFQITSKTRTETETEEEKYESTALSDSAEKEPEKAKKRLMPLLFALLLGIVIIAYFIVSGIKNQGNEIDSGNSQLIKEVKIGNQVWMVENLKTTRYNDGTSIPLVKNNKEWQNLKTPAYCWYDNKRTNFRNTYGALYNWYTVNTGKLCPVGWHVPSDAEWRTLTHFLGDSIYFVKEVAGDKLKEAGNAHWEFQDTINSVNEYGFTALPGGTRTIYGGSFGIGKDGNWWSSSDKYVSNGDAVSRQMRYDFGGISKLPQYKQTGCSVRCIKDDR